MKTLITLTLTVLALNAQDPSQTIINPVPPPPLVEDEILKGTLNYPKLPPKPINVNAGEQISSVNITQVANLGQAVVIQIDHIAPQEEHKTYLYTYRVSCPSWRTFDVSTSSTLYITLSWAAEPDKCSFIVDRYTRTDQGRRY